MMVGMVCLEGSKRLIDCLIVMLPHKRVASSRTHGYYRVLCQYDQTKATAYLHIHCVWASQSTWGFARQRRRSLDGVLKTSNQLRPLFASCHWHSSLEFTGQAIRRVNQFDSRYFSVGNLRWAPEVGCKSLIFSPMILLESEFKLSM